MAHHRSGHRRDNRPENIEVMERGEHTTAHMNDDWTEEDGFPVLVNPRDEET